MINRFARKKLTHEVNLSGDFFVKHRNLEIKTEFVSGEEVIKFLETIIDNKSGDRSAARE